MLEISRIVWTTLGRGTVYVNIFPLSGGGGDETIHRPRRRQSVVVARLRCNYSVKYASRDQFEPAETMPFLPPTRGSSLVKEGRGGGEE